MIVILLAQDGAYGECWRCKLRVLRHDPILTTEVLDVANRALPVKRNHQQERATEGDVDPSAMFRRAELYEQVSVEDYFVALAALEANENKKLFELARRI